MVIMENTQEQPAHTGPEMASIILTLEAARAKDKAANLMGPNSKWVRAYRRKIRYKIFRIREGKWQTDKELAALKSWFDLQIAGFKDYTWDSFTFEWDVSATDPLKVISSMEWDGGLIKDQWGTHCDPAAFTKQEK